MKSTKRFDSVYFIVARRPDGYVKYIQVSVYHTTKCYVYRQVRTFSDTYKQDQLQVLADGIEAMCVPLENINSILENCRKYMYHLDYMPDNHHPLYGIVNFVEQVARTFKYRKG